MDGHELTRRPGGDAQAQGLTLHSRRIGARPILDRFLARRRLDASLRDHLPREDRRARVPAATVLLLLVRNRLISREPLDGVGQWAAKHAPARLGLTEEQLSALNDDRVGRCLDRLFDADVAALARDVAAQAVREFDVALDELPNDSTTVSFDGDDQSAERERTLRGRLRRAVPWGHNKDHRPDLKQLLDILTVTGDGAVPVPFRVQSGNTTDDRSHRSPWDFLCRLTGRRDFLCGADCKLATAESMACIHHEGGRFLSVRPRTRGEDAAFRARVSAGEVSWRPIHDTWDDEGDLLDRFSICEPATQSAEGDRLVWYHRTRKAERDATARLRRIERALVRLDELGQKLASPRTRYRAWAKVAEAVDTILRECDVAGWISVAVVERTTESFRPAGRGRPGATTRSVRHERTRFELRHRIEFERLAEEARCDGVFPLITKDGTLSERELLLAYKEQPALERRFEPLKTDFAVAPVSLKEASRIPALLCISFLVLLVEALWERALRGAMERSGLEDLPLDPEGRPCRRPTARRVIDLFEDVQRHPLSSGQPPPTVFTTELTKLQGKVLRLLGMPDAY